jgi:hypothetical protein
MMSGISSRRISATRPDLSNKRYSGEPGTCGEATV